VAAIYDPLQPQPGVTPTRSPDVLAPQPGEELTPEQIAQTEGYFPRGLRSALAGGVGSATQYVGAEAGIPALEQWGAETAQKGAEVAPPGLNLTDVKDVPSALRFGVGLAGTAVGGTLPTLVGGVGGAAAGLRAARLLGTGAKASRVLGATGAFTGAYTTAFPMEAGETFGNLAQAGIDKATALRQAEKKAAVNAVLEAAVPVVAMNPLARIVLGRSRWAHAVAGEAATEAAQEVSGQFFQSQVDPSFRMDDPARAREILTSALAGAMGGGILTAPAVLTDVAARQPGRALRDITGEGIEVGKRLVTRLRKSAAGEVAADTVEGLALQADQLREEAKNAATPEAAEQLVEQAKALGVATRANIGDWVARVRADPRAAGAADMRVLSDMLKEQGITKESAREVMLSALEFTRENARDGREYVRGILTAAGSPEAVNESGAIETDARKNQIRDWLRGAGDAVVPPEISTDLRATIDYLKNTAPKVKTAQAAAWFRELDDDLQTRVLDGIGKNFTNPVLQSRVAFASRVQELRDDDTRLTAIADRVTQGIRGKNLSLEPTQRDVTFAQKLRRAILSNKRIDLQDDEATQHIDHLINNVVAISRSPAIRELDGLTRAEITRVLDRLLPADIPADLAQMLKRFGLIETGLKEYTQPEAMQVTSEIVARHMQQAGTSELIQPKPRELRDGTTVDDGQTALDTISRAVMRLALDSGYSVTSSRAEMERTIRNLSVAFNGDTDIMQAAVNETAQALEAQLPTGITGAGEAGPAIGEQVAGQMTPEEQAQQFGGEAEQYAQNYAEPAVPEGWQVREVAKPRVYHYPSSWIDTSGPQALQNADAYVADVVQQLEYETGGPYVFQGVEGETHPVSLVRVVDYAQTKPGNTQEERYNATIQELIDQIKPPGKARPQFDTGTALPEALRNDPTFQKLAQQNKRQFGFLKALLKQPLEVKHRYLNAFSVVQAEVINPKGEAFSPQQLSFMRSVGQNDDFIPLTLASEKVRTVEGKRVKPGYEVLRFNPLRISWAIFRDTAANDSLPQTDSLSARYYFAFTQGVAQLLSQLALPNEMSIFGFPGNQIPEVKKFTKLNFNFDEDNIGDPKGLQGFLNLISPPDGGQPTPGWYRSPQADVLVSPGFVRVIDKTHTSANRPTAVEYTTLRPDLVIGFYPRQGNKAPVPVSFARAKAAANDVLRVGDIGIGKRIAEQALERANDAFNGTLVKSSILYEGEDSYEGATAELLAARDQLLAKERGAIYEHEQDKENVMIERKLRGITSALTQIESAIEALDDGMNIFSESARYSDGEWSSSEIAPTPGSTAAAGEVFEIAEKTKKRKERQIRRFEDDLFFTSALLGTPEVGKENRFRRTAGSFESEAADLINAAESATDAATKKVLLARANEVMNFRDQAATTEREYRAAARTPVSQFPTKKARTAAVKELQDKLQKLTTEAQSVARGTDYHTQLMSQVRAVQNQLNVAKKAEIVKPKKTAPQPRGEIQPPITVGAVTGRRFIGTRGAEELVKGAAPKKPAAALRPATEVLPARKKVVREMQPFRVAPAARLRPAFSRVAGLISDITGISDEHAAAIAQFTKPLPARYALADILDRMQAGSITEREARSEAAKYLGRYGVKFDIKPWRERGALVPATITITNEDGTKRKVPYAVGKTNTLAASSQPFVAPTERTFTAAEKSLFTKPLDQYTLDELKALRQSPEFQAAIKRTQRPAKPRPTIKRVERAPKRAAPSPNFMAVRRAITERLKALEAARGDREASPVEQLYKELADMPYNTLNDQQRAVYASIVNVTSRPGADLDFIRDVAKKAGLPGFGTDPVAANMPKRKGTTSHFIYAGIGSRETPTAVLEFMKRLAGQLENAGFHLRSGGAEGADSAFASGVKDETNQTVYEPRHATPEMIKFAANFHPAWAQVVKGGWEKLHARNVMQILGRNFTDAANASDFVVYYDNPLVSRGGTKTAVAIAAKKGIPAFNLFYGEPAKAALRAWLKQNYPDHFKTRAGGLVGVTPKEHVAPASDMTRTTVKPPSAEAIAAARTRLRGPSKPKTPAVEATADIPIEQEPKSDLTNTEAATLDDLKRQFGGDFNLEQPKKGRKKKPPITQKEIVDLARKLLGKEITVEWMNTDWEIEINGKKYRPSGQFADENGTEIIRLAVSARDPLLKAHHEAMHALLSRMAKNADTRHIVDKLIKATSTPQVMKQLREILPAEARAQLDDPLERVAYAYQYWTVNKVAFGPTAKNLFQKVADLVRRLVKAIADHQVAETVFDAFSKGELASKELLATRLRAKLPESYYDKARDLLKPVVDVYNNYIATSDTRMRATNVRALIDLADMFKPEVGARGQDLGFIQNKFRVTSQWLNKFAAILDGTNEEQRLKAAELLHSQAEDAGPLGNKIRTLLDDMWDYIDASGVKRYEGWNREKGGVQWGPVQKRAKYFPFAFDKEAVYKDHDGFVKMLADNKIDRRKAEEIWTAIAHRTAIAGVEDGEFGNLQDGVAYTPLFSGIEARTLNHLHADPRFIKFADKDLVSVMSRYVHQMVARAEYTKRFGEEGQVLKDKIAQAKKQGATPEQLALATNYVRAMEGTYGRDADPELRKWTGSLIVYQNVRLLGMALFSSFVDPLGLWVRGASFTDATKAFINGIADVFRSESSIVKEKGHEIAELVGTIDRTSMLESMGQMYGSTYLTPWQRKVNDFMFWLNGMNAWNTSMRTSATLSAMKFIKLHAELAKKGDDTSIRYLDELNLKPGDVKLGADGEVDVRNDRIQKAIHLWVDDAILRPTAADRPIWASDPIFAIFFHLKQYTYSFQKHILGRAFHEANNGNMLPIAALGAYIPVMLGADITRGFIQGMGEQPSYRHGWTAGDWLWNSVQRSGLTGVSQFAIDTANDLDYKGVGYETILGPTASQFSKGLQTLFGSGSLQNFAVGALPGQAWFKHW
jgi:hypothetical protein